MPFTTNAATSLGAIPLRTSSANCSESGPLGGGAPYSLGQLRAAFANARRNPTGAENTDADALGLKLRRQCFGNSHHRKFARGVSAETGAAEKPRHRGGVDNVAALAMALEQRQECLHPVHYPHHIDVDHP